jgi:CDP-diacylglycerol---serine O-phosphatidyltransferase
VNDVFEERRTDDRHYRRGIYLLPSLFTIGNMFCGYASIVHAMWGEFAIAASYVGVAFVLDSLDGRIARYTNTTSAFGVELDSLADVISFGLAPAVLAFAWGLTGLGRWGWAIGFLYVTAAALRLARFNIQSGGQDKRYFVGMPSPSAAGVVAATVFAWPERLTEGPIALIAVVVILGPAFLMVSTIKFRAFKAVNFGWVRNGILPLIFFAGLIVFIWTMPRIALVILSYGYLISAIAEWAITRMRMRRATAGPPAGPPSP